MSASDVVTASRPPRPASCISAAPARPCSTGSTPAIMAASSCCRIEDTDKARSTQAAIDAILDGMTWLGLDWDGEAYFQSEFADRHAEVAQRAAGQRPCLSMLDEPGGARRRSARRRRPSGGRSGSAARGATATRRPAGRAFRGPAEGAAGGRDGDRRPGAGPGHGPERGARRFRAAALGRHRRPTCSRWWSTITTWASPTSSAATTISTTPSASSRSSGRWAGPSRSTATCR